MSEDTTAIKAVTKEMLLAVAEAARKTPEIESVDSPELGGRVYFKGLTGKQRDVWEQWCVVGEGKNRHLKNVQGKLLARTLCDEHGTRTCLDADSEWLGNLPGPIIRPLYLVAARLSGISEDVKENLEPLSDDEDSGASSSGSRSD